MCGICGFTGSEDRSLLQKMTSVITYRGPDSSGAFIDKDVSLGVRRLSIIDLKTGKQPIHNEDQDIWIVYNGELYNYKSLRRQLELRGHRFYTVTDTEVVVHAYEEYGEEFAKELRGMYGFAIWDSKKKKLVLGRDEAGIKPLYYCMKDSNLIFGSEIKCILEYPGIERKINLDALDCFFTFGSVLGEDTLFQGIKKILPGHLLIYENGIMRIKRFWTFNMEPKEHDEMELIARIKTLLNDSVTSQLMSDVPLGAYLSGGIDSSAVVGTMSKAMEKPVETFTVGFGEEDDEVEHARVISQAFSTNHHEVFIKDNELPKIMPDLAYHFDDLIGDAAMVPTYLLSRFAKKYVTVVLTGEGGDEIFGGYNRYKPMGDLFFFVPKQFRINFFADVITIFNRNAKDSVYSAGMLNSTKNLEQYKKYLQPYFGQKGNLLNQTLLFGFEQILPNQLLAKVDRTTMASSIEARVPLLDKELIALTGTIRSDLKLRFLDGKYIFKKALKDLIPQRILKRKKHGFDVPLMRWFRGELGEYAKQVLSEERKRDYIDRYKLDKILADNLNFKDKKQANRVWHLLLLELWVRRFIDQA